MKTFAAISALVAIAAAHGIVTDPAPRAPGDAFKAACGAQLFSNVASGKLPAPQPVPRVVKPQNPLTGSLTSTPQTPMATSNSSSR